MTINLNHVANQVTTTGSNTNIPLVFQSKGTGAIDLAAGSSGVNISNGGTVTAITVTAAGSGYTTIPSLAISAPTTAGGVQATASPLMFSGSATIASGGTGYTVGDVLLVTGGTYSSQASYTVAAVSAGVVTSVTRTTGSGYSALPTNPASTTGGTGTGCTLNATWTIGGGAPTITNAGSGYVEQPTVSFSGGGGSGAAAYASVGSNVNVKSLANQLTFQTAMGTALFLQNYGANQTTNYYAAFASATGNPAILEPRGDTNTTAVLSSRGASPVQFYTNGFSGGSTGLLQLNVAHTASAVNYAQVTGAATGGQPVISAQGSDSNINLVLNAKGSASVLFQTAGQNVFQATGSGTVTNRLLATGTATGVAPSMSCVGGDTNIDLALTTKGTGLVKSNASYGVTAQNTSIGGFFGSGLGFDQTVTAASAYGRIQPYSLSDGLMYLDSAYSAGGFVFRTTTSLFTQFKVSNTTSAVNYVQVTGAVTTTSPTISAQGSDANIGVSITTKGTFGGTFKNSAGSNIFSWDHSNTSTQNYFGIASSSAGSAPVLSAKGTDTNIDLTLTPKGTGYVQFGTYTANMALTVQGYIEVKDSSGTVRKLAVIA